MKIVDGSLSTRYEKFMTSCTSENPKRAEWQAVQLSNTCFWNVLVNTMKSSIPDHGLQTAIKEKRKKAKEEKTQKGKKKGKKGKKEKREKKEKKEKNEQTGKREKREKKEKRKKRKKKKKKREKRNRK